MKKWMFVLITCLCGTQLLAQGTYQEKVNNYVQKYRDLAIAEQQRSGIPACITLGQGILETSAGSSELMTQANNHFGIKCKKEWRGETFAHTDDAPNECFRKYKCDLDSYKDHSDYLKTSARYASLFVLDPADYKGWAHGLKRCGYATNPRYAQQLIKIIEDFHLQDYTYAAANTAPAQAPVVRTAGTETVSVAVVPQHIVTDTPVTTHNISVTSAANSNGTMQVNGLRAFYGHKGDVLLEYAIRYNMRYARLLELNDLPDAPLEADMFVYLERKNSKGVHARHIMQPGETLLQAAQAEGMQLKQLRVLNQLGDNEQPAEGVVLQCQVAAAGKPAVKENTGSQVLYADNSQSAAGSDYITKPVTAAPATNATTEETEEETDEPVQKTQPVAATPVVEKKETPPPPPVRVVRAASPPPAPRSTQDNSTFNIANEKAVEETIVRNNPRYIERNEDAPAMTAAPAAVTATTPANIQPERTVTKPAEQPVQEAEPQDELARLKAKLDKVVYGNERYSGNNAMKVSYDAPATNPAPAPVKAEPQTVTVAPPPSAEAAKFYTVQKGDTAFGIAKKNGITMKQLMDWNHLNFEDIKVGQKLRIK